MKNVNMKVTGNMLTIIVDLTKRHGPSSTGKTIIIASTEGAEKLGADHPQVGLSLTVWTKEKQS